MNQAERVLALLRDARTNNTGVCATVFLNIDIRIPRVAARISDLRRDGYAIETVKCVQHFHGTRQIMYRLVSEPGEELAFDI